MTILEWWSVPQLIASERGSGVNTTDAVAFDTPQTIESEINAIGKSHWHQAPAAPRIMISEQLYR